MTKTAMVCMQALLCIQKICFSCAGTFFISAFVTTAGSVFVSVCLNGWAAVWETDRVRIYVKKKLNTIKTGHT